MVDKRPPLFPRSTHSPAVPVERLWSPPGACSLRGAARVPGLWAARWSILCLLPTCVLFLSLPISKISSSYEEASLIHMCA
ncbi:hypothetical protein Micbo1qcDRAFT_156293 [Microdochium bolleyi]|uniref:Uncharacterized protein n=1 Tax=Microdochium bolleyi TaxID=196109 RepID=A0A136JJT6_9PEZI|nr:hypothetical protein Micbo1qcDRAFT_156293 [Microdochium bolleyi]